MTTRNGTIYTSNPERLSLFGDGALPADYEQPDNSGEDDAADDILEPLANLQVQPKTVSSSSSAPSKRKVATKQTQQEVAQSPADREVNELASQVSSQVLILAARRRCISSVVSRRMFDADASRGELGTVYSYILPAAKATGSTRPLKASKEMFKGISDVIGSVFQILAITGYGTGRPYEFFKLVSALGYALADDANNNDSKVTKAIMSATTGASAFAAITGPASSQVDNASDLFR